jgi:hypothetical protein
MTAKPSELGQRVERLVTGERRAPASRALLPCTVFGVSAFAFAVKRVKHTPPVFLYLQAKAAPAPMGIWAPTIPCPPRFPTSAWNRCIEPPLPLLEPVTRPNISAIATLGSIPRAKECPWSR